jgi:hypothetical protein
MTNQPHLPYPHATVTERALIGRINRKLASNCQQLIDLERLARKLDCLGPWETIVKEPA